MSGFDDWAEVYESDGAFIHTAAAHGETLEGKLLPTETDEEGRVWATCTFGERFEVKPKKPRS